MNTSNTLEKIIAVAVNQVRRLCLHRFRQAMRRLSVIAWDFEGLKG